MHITYEIPMLTWHIDGISDCLTVVSRIQHVGSSLTTFSKPGWFLSLKLDAFEILRTQPITCGRSTHT